MSATNPSFEDGATGWALSGSAEISLATSRTGSASLMILGVHTEVLGTPFQLFGAAVQSGIPLVSGVEYTLSVWVKGVEDSGCPIILSADLGGGFTEIARQSVTTGPSVWSRLSGSKIATGSIGAISVDVPLPEFGKRVVWYADDVVLAAEEGDVALTGQIRDALLADLERVTTENGFEATLKAVYPNPVSPDRAVFPCAVVGKPIGGSSEPEDLGNRVGLRLYQFPIQLWVKSASPFEDLDALLDAVCNSIERSDSNVLAVPSVHQVDVVEFDSTGTSNEGAGSLTDYLEIGVQVIAHYLRGAA